MISRIYVDTSCVQYAVIHLGTNLLPILCSVDHICGVPRWENNVQGTLGTVSDYPTLELNMSSRFLGWIVMIGGSCVVTSLCVQQIFNPISAHRGH